MICMPLGVLGYAMASGRLPFLGIERPRINACAHGFSETRPYCHIVVGFLLGFQDGLIR